MLDEPTVHLDKAAAGRVAATIAELRGSTTVLLITHDRDLAARADREVRLEGGRTAGAAGHPAAASRQLPGGIPAVAEGPR